MDLKRIYDIEILNNITNQIVKWNYETIKGEGIYLRTEKFAYITLKIYTSSETNSYRDQIIWNVSEEEIPEIYYNEIEEILIFFSNHITALKGKRETPLIFEVCDGSFSMDSNRNSFAYATIRAIAKSFDENLFPITENIYNQIRYCKANAREVLKSYAQSFTQESKIESMLNDPLTQSIKNLFNQIELDELNSLLNNNKNKFEEIIKEKLLNNRIFFTENNILTKYGDFSRIGYCHFSKILNRKDILPFVGVFDFDKIDKYFT